MVFIPMGTVVTVCMLLAILLGLAGRYLPAMLVKGLAAVCAAAGAWNVLWYGLRHLGEFWGHMALASGALMFALSAFILKRTPTESAGSVASAVLALLLLPFALYYGWTIYHL